MMSTIHSAVYVEVKKRNGGNTKVKKPLAVFDYTQRMGGVDKSDQFMNYYNGVRRSLKWTTKLAIHLFSMCVTNAYILYTKYGDKTEKIDHEEYILKVAEYLIEEGIKTRVLRNPPDRSRVGRKLQLRDQYPE